MTLTVYSWQDDRTQTRRVCAAGSIADLLRLTGYPSKRWLFNLGTVTQGRPGYDMAMAEHHVIFARSVSRANDPWVRVH